MNTATSTNAPKQTLRSTLGDFAKALYAAQQRAFAVTDLLSLANEYQQHSPSLSTELRSIASRG